MTKAQTDFIGKIAPLATAEMKKTGLLASLTIAQAILETGWGTSGLTKRSNNLFGIKGNGVSSKTFEYIGGKRAEIVDSFKFYPDFETCIADRSALIMRLPRYRNLIGCTDYKTACRNIQADGWATAPNYADCLIRLIEQYRLYEYDRSDKQEISVGSRVRIVGTHYATGQKIPRWVKEKVLTVAEIKNGKALVNPIYSWVYITDLTEV